MTKVWVLEKYQTVEEMQRTLKECEEMYITARESGEEKYILMAGEMLEKWRIKMEENPNGYWSGWEGKSIYKQFCEVAKAAIRRAPKGTQFRVIEGEVEDNSKVWLGYKVVKVNDGVLRYLMTTK